jgi:hypothetical protein
MNLVSQSPAPLRLKSRRPHELAIRQPKPNVSLTRALCLTSYKKALHLTSGTRSNPLSSMKIKLMGLVFPFSLEVRDDKRHVS